MKKFLALGAVLLFLFPTLSFSQTIDSCQGNFDCDTDVDGADAFLFKKNYGRSLYNDPCAPCEPTATSTTTTLPEPRFSDNGDGTVTDNDSGLVWLTNGFCDELNNTDLGLNWDEATTVVANLASGTCGLMDGSAAGDWRLPTKDEWDDFVCSQYTGPAICGTDGAGQWSQGDPFNGVQPFYYWSSSPVESGMDNAWTVSMDYGTTIIGSISSNNYVWPLRN